MERKKSLPSQNVEKTILFVSDIDRTLIYPQRFARKGDVCIEWSEDGKELSYANPYNLEDLIKLSKLTKLVLVTARTEEQYRRIKWPEELEIHSVVINLGNDLLFSQEINPQEWNEKTDNSMKEHLEDLKNASKWLSEQEFVERCSIRNDRFTFARFNDKWNANEKRTLQDKLKSDFNCNCDLMGERLYLTIPGHDKGTAVSRLTKHLHPDTVMVAGDDKPDVPMLLHANCTIVDTELLWYGIINAYTAIGRTDDFVIYCYDRNEGFSKDDTSNDGFNEEAKHVVGFVDYVHSKALEYVEESLEQI